MSNARRLLLTIEPDVGERKTAKGDQIEVQKGRAIPTHQLGASSAVDYSAERLLLSLSVSKKSLEVGGLEKRTKNISSRD